MDRKITVLAVVFALAVGSDGALKCYMCNTATNSSCGDDIINSALKPVELGDKKVTIRNCQIAKTESLNPCDAIKKKLSMRNQKQPELQTTLDFCDVCEEDACNGKMVMVPKAFYMIFPVVTALALGNGNYMA